MLRVALIGLWSVAHCLISGCSVLPTQDKSRASLEANYLESPDDMIDIAGTPIHIRYSGPQNGPAVILLHGIGSHLQTWDAWALELEKNYRTIRFDLPGAGLSPPDKTGDYTDARAMILISSIMDELGLERASLIGNSLGGRIAWSFAATYPDRCESLVLIAPDGFASPMFEYGTRPNVPIFMILVRYTLPKWVLRRILEAAYSDSSLLTPETVQRYHDLIRAPGARSALIARMRQTILVQPEPMLELISAPVLLVWGEEDSIIPISNAVDYLSALKNVAFVPLQGVGHLPQEEAPAETVQPVLAFLKNR